MYNELTQVTGTTTQTIIATGSGFLKQVNLNTVTGTTKLTIGNISTVLGGTTSLALRTYQYDCRFNGTLAVTLGSATNDVVVTWSR
jgi:hypothetical protein